MAGKYQRYPEYKESGIDWLGEVPEHWRIVKLKRVANFITGTTPPTSDQGLYSETETEYCWIRPEEISDTSPVVRATKYLSKEGWQYQRVVPKNSVLVCCIGTIGKAALCQQAVTTNQQITAVVPSFDFKLCYYQLIAARPSLENLASGNVVKILNTERFSNFFISLVQKDEQRAISNFLDHETAKIDALIEKQEKLIELLNEKRQAVISHAVTKGLNPDVPMEDSGIEWLGEVPEHWTVGRFKNCTKRIIVGVAEAATHAYAPEGVPIIRSTNIKESGLETSKLLYLKPEFADSLASKAILGKDIVTVRTGYPGISSIVPQEFAGSQCFTNLISTPKHKLFLSEFLVAVLNSRRSKEYFALEGWGSAQKNISVPILEQLPLSWPSLQEQKEIANYIRLIETKFDHLLSKSLSSVRLLKERKASLISAAVTGKIDVRTCYSAAEER